jgi:hypothetical protein
MDVSSQTVCPSHFTAREKAGVGDRVGAGAGLGVLRKRVLLFLPRLELQIFCHIC